MAVEEMMCPPREAEGSYGLGAGDRVDAGSQGAALGKPKGGKALWVLNGRVYNYRKEGAAPVPNQAAAQEAVRAQQAAAQAIHGLGAGGNKPSPDQPAGERFHAAARTRVCC